MLGWFVCLSVTMVTADPHYLWNRVYSSRLKGHSAKSHGFQSHNVDRSGIGLLLKQIIHVCKYA